MNRTLLLLLLNLIPGAMLAWNCNDSLGEWDKQRGTVFAQRKDELEQIIRKAYAMDSCGCLANAYRRMGTLWKDQGHPDTAINNYLKALNFAEKANDILSQGSCYNQIGAVYYLMGRNKKAYAFFFRAFELYQSANHIGGMSDAGLNCASVRMDENNLAEAERWCLKSIDYCKLGNSGAGNPNALMALIAFRKKNTEQAENYFKKAMLSATRLGAKYAIPLYTDWGMFCAERQMPDTALHYLRQAYQLAAARKYEYLRADAAQKLAILFRAGGQSDSAYHYSKEALQAKDTLHKQQMLINALDAAEKYGSEQKEKELMLERELSDERLLVIILLLALLLVMAIGVVFLLRNNRQRRKIK